MVFRLATGKGIGNCLFVCFAVVVVVAVVARSPGVEQALCYVFWYLEVESEIQYQIQAHGIP